EGYRHWQEDSHLHGKFNGVLKPSRRARDSKICKCKASRNPRDEAMLRQFEVADQVKKKENEKLLFGVDNLQNEIVDYEPLPHNAKFTEGKSTIISKCTRS